jgi:tetratricopeptide (TPR) repeat protein
MAEFYLDNSEPNRALGAYEAMIASGTAGPEVYARASELLLAGDRADDGERMLRDALARFPRTAYAHMRLGSYLAALTRYQEAIPVLERAAELAPGDPLVQRSLSLARVRTGDEVGARAAAQRFYELAPGPDSGVPYASRLEAGGQRDAAVAIYREVLRAAPDSALALNNLAFMLAGENEGEDEDALEEAGTMARRATSLAPTNGNVWDTLGWILHLQGDDAGAAEALDRAISLGPATASVHYHRGVVLHSTGRAAEAQEALREALTREPGASWSRDAEARLEDMR